MRNKFERDFYGNKHIDNMNPNKREAMKELYENDLFEYQQLSKCQDYVTSLIKENKDLKGEIYNLKLNIRELESKLRVIKTKDALCLHVALKEKKDE